MRFLTAVAAIVAFGYVSLYALATFVSPRSRDMTVSIPSQRLRPPPPSEALAKNPKTAGAETASQGATTQ